MISASVGGRLVMANNKYTGYLKNIMIDPDMSSHPLGAALPMYTGDRASATDFFTNMSTALSSVASSAYAGGTAMDNLVTAAPTLTFAEAEAGIPSFDAAARAQLEGGLVALGISQSQIDLMTLAQAQGTYQTLGDGYTSSATDATNNATESTDRDVDVVQTGIGFTPIIGISITPNDKLNIGIKWEGRTNLELKNKTTVDGTGMFPDGETTDKDMPMMFSAGVQYKITDAFRAQAGYHLFMDKKANWGGREDLVDNNLYELSIGAEYDLSDMITVSAGYLKGTTGVSEHYQDNLSFSLSSNTVSLGAKLNLSEQLNLDFGVGKMMYVDSDENEVSVNQNLASGEIGHSAYKTNYDKEGIMFAIGVNYSIF
jgi:long-chain fatty acid transport protein